MRPQYPWRSKSVQALRRTSRDRSQLLLSEPDKESACLSFHVACPPYIYPVCKTYPTARYEPAPNADELGEPRQDALPVLLVSPAGVRDGGWRLDRALGIPYLSRQIVHRRALWELRCCRSVLLEPRLGWTLSRHRLPSVEWSEARDVVLT